MRLQLAHSGPKCYAAGSERGRVSLAFINRAAATIILIVVLSLTFKLVPNGGVVTTFFVSMTILFTLGFVVAVSEGPRKKKLLWVLLSPVAGALLSGLFLSLFYFWWLFLILLIGWIVIAGLMQYFSNKS